MAKQPNLSSTVQTPRPGPQPRSIDPFVRKAGKERLHFLETEDLGVLGARIRVNGGRGLTDELYKAGESAKLWFEKEKRRGATDAEAEEAAMRECIRPDSQKGGPILPEAEKKETLALLEQWKATPEAGPFLE